MPLFGKGPKTRERTSSQTHTRTQSYPNTLGPQVESISASSTSLPRWNSSSPPSSPAQDPLRSLADLDLTLPQSQERDIQFQDEINDKFSEIISLIDEEIYNGRAEVDLTMCRSPPPPYTFISGHLPETTTSRSLPMPISHYPVHKPQASKTTATTNTTLLSKLDLYSNSLLPINLPPLRIYLPTYPLLCLAAQHSLSAYTPSNPTSFIPHNASLGTKAMVLSSVPLDSKKVLIFAIRGTSLLSYRDWNVNLATTPIPPTDFLDDSGNLCHAGFLKTARAMVGPIAQRLRQLLEENPSRATCSLLITGHSAGGAVANLLYAHMLSQSVQSELTILAGCFKRVHCVTFGAPPVTLLPLQKPAEGEKRWAKYLFHSFVNEGDPVARAEKRYVRSLVELLACPAQAVTKVETGAAVLRKHAGAAKRDAVLGKPVWKVPQATLSNAGRVVVLRVPRGREERDVEACVASDEELRKVIWGDPEAHSMNMYARRVEWLSVRAVTGRS